MALIKKIDVEKHFAARRAMRLAGALHVSRTDAPVISGTKTTDAKMNAKDFAQDFSIEHSSRGLVPPSK